jgi:hypothetical protein
LRQRLLVAIPQCNLGAAARKALRDRQSDAHRSAGDGRRASRKIELVHRYTLAFN